MSRCFKNIAMDIKSPGEYGDMDLMEAIRRRHSVRSYRDKEVPEETLQQVLEAARLAPSAKNRQEWTFVVVTDENTRRELQQAAKGQRFVGEAPVVIAGIATETGYVMSCGVPAAHVDVAIAMEHIALAAAAHGLGTCWIGAFYQDAARDALDVPGDCQVVALMPLGYPADTPGEKKRKPLDAIMSREHFTR